MLEIRNLSKSYGKKVALNNINLKLNKNKEVFKAVLVLVAIAVFIIACINGQLL